MFFFPFSQQKSQIINFSSEDVIFAPFNFSVLFLARCFRVRLTGGTLVLKEEKLPSKLF